MRLTVKKAACILLVIALFTSCNDEQLTKDAVGKWKVEIDTEDGKEKIYYLLGKDGKLEETTYFYNHEYEDGIKMTVKFKSSIKGTWEILWGDLDLSYDISSLKVQYLGMEFPGLSNLEKNLANALISGFASSLVKEEETDLYNHLYDYYETESSFLDVKIRENTMRFTTEDGVVQLKKVTD